MVLLDDLVLDISKFKFEHPGGTFLIEHHIGYDISKFFYGGYTLEIGSGMKPYTHSNVARKIVNSIAIGRLNDLPTNSNAAIIKKTSINSSTSVFTLKLIGDEASFTMPNSSDVSNFGRHYLIRSVNAPKIYRHYTLS